MTPRPPRRYLSRPEIATRLGVSRKTVDGYTLPPPDAITGVLPGWLPGTVDAWDRVRRKRGGES
jgi:predicted DNA-binding transcriptional regulator AlpA